MNPKMVSMTNCRWGSLQTRRDRTQPGVSLMEMHENSKDLMRFRFRGLRIR